MSKVLPTRPTRKSKRYRIIEKYILYCNGWRSDVKTKSIDFASSLLLFLNNNNQFSEWQNFDRKYFILQIFQMDQHNHTKNVSVCFRRDRHWHGKWEWNTSNIWRHFYSHSISSTLFARRKNKKHERDEHLNSQYNCWIWQVYSQTFSYGHTNVWNFCHKIPSLNRIHVICESE